MVGREIGRRPRACGGRSRRRRTVPLMVRAGLQYPTAWVSWAQESRCRRRRLLVHVRSNKGPATACRFLTLRPRPVQCRPSSWLLTVPQSCGWVDAPRTLVSVLRVARYASYSPSSPPRAPASASPRVRQVWRGAAPDFRRGSSVATASLPGCSVVLFSYVRLTRCVRWVGRILSPSADSACVV